MKKIFFLSSLIFTVVLYAGKLDQQLWRELDLAKYQNSAVKKQQQDMAWLEDTIDKEDTSLTKKETVDQVMAEFNHEQKQSDQSVNIDHISLKMAAPQRKFQRGISRSPALAPKSRKKLLREYRNNLKEKIAKDLPLTRQRSR